MKQIYNQNAVAILMFNHDIQYGLLFNSIQQDREVEQKIWFEKKKINWKNENLAKKKKRKEPD